MRNAAEIAALVQTVKEKGGPLLTNFFFDAEKNVHWLTDGQLYYEATEAGVLFFRKKEAFFHLYYCVTTKSGLHQLVTAHLPEARLTTDIIGKPQATAGIVELFLAAGFVRRTQLQRYTRIHTAESHFFQPSEDVTIATLKEADEIASLFNENFDPLAEQVPTAEEVKTLTKEKKVLMISDGSVVKGFLARTFTGQTTVLNNFLVRPNYRGEKIGSKLLGHYIFEAKDAKRMTLWVKTDNATAIGMYENYGYKKEDMADCVLIK